RPFRSHTAACIRRSDTALGFDDEHARFPDRPGHVLGARRGEEHVPSFEGDRPFVTVLPDAPLDPPAERRERLLALIAVPMIRRVGPVQARGEPCRPPRPRYRGQHTPVSTTAISPAA